MTPEIITRSLAAYLQEQGVEATPCLDTSPNVCVGKNLRIYTLPYGIMIVKGAFWTTDNWIIIEYSDPNMLDKLITLVKA